MKTQKVILIAVCILVFLGCTSAIAAEKKAYSNTLNASALFRIQADPSFLWIDGDDSFNAICKPAYQQAFHDIYGDYKTKEKQDYEESIEGMLASVNFLGSLEIPGLDMAIQGTININLDTLYGEYPLAAQEIKESFLKRLRGNLNRAFEEYRQSLKDREQAFARQVDETEAKMNELRKAIVEITGGKKMSREFLEEQITGLSKELQEAEFHLRAGENRIQLVQKQLAEADARQQQMKANDPILKEFEEKLELLEQRLQQARKLFEAGEVSAAEIQEIEQRLIEARIELAERREMAKESPEAHRVRELKEQLTHLSLEQSEQKMRIPFLDEQLHEARNMLERSTEYETLRIKAEVQRKSLFESMEQFERVRRDNSLLTPPILTVISQ